METAEQFTSGSLNASGPRLSDGLNQLRQNEDFMLALGGAAICFVGGYVVGSRRWEAFAPFGRRLLSHMGAIALGHALEILRT